MDAHDVLNMVAVAFSYDGARPVFEDLSFRVGEGKFVTLLGDNGTGKSTIAKLAECLIEPSAGTVSVFGTKTSEPDAALKIRPHIGVVLQNPDDQLMSARVIDDIAFGPGNLGCPEDELIRRTHDVLELLGIEKLAYRDVNELSGGQKQRVAIAGALAMEPQLLILDEATSMLDAPAREAFLKTIQALHARGLSILMITHAVGEACLADEIVFLERVGANGEKKVRRFTKEGGYDELEAHRTRLIEAARPLISGSGERAHTNKGCPPAIAFDHVSFRYPDSPTAGSAPTARASCGNASATSAPATSCSASAPSNPRETWVLDDVSLRIEAGELVALTGENGSGKSTLIKHMNGLLRPTSGTVSVQGRPLLERTDANEARLIVGVVFQYPEKQLFASTVFEEVSFGLKCRGIAPDEYSARVMHALESLNLNAQELSSRNPFTLSGGQMRKVAIADVLVTEPDILVLDEPCVSLDLPARLELLSLIRRINDTGVTVIIVTHEREDIELLGCREIRLCAGHVVGL